ncbi:chitinase, putative [Ixodes scapularis]|uniref:Chitinase, putative n=1 Tax=Ixodes scapularis TaxID=6945 RepID=B7P5R4_IXOSC|nr:chitinase, putative [Ixodes scapularis]|eukprot:XP_002407804.1 chitinase, putative [Ixodes scapularis]
MKIAILMLACLAHTVLGQSQRNGRQTNSTISNVNSTAPSSTRTMPIVCYYYGWAATRPDPASYDVDKIPGDLCTHVNFAYAGVAPNTWELDSQVPRYDADKGLYKKFTAIKDDYPKLKTLLSVGGWQHPNGVFSQMSSTPQNRQKFITSVLQWMKEYNLDGVDLAWPFPGVDYRGGGPQDKENYVQLAKICLFLKSGWTREFDDQGKAPYAYYNNQWIGYEDTESIKHKMNFLLREGYAGVYVFNNDMDDFRGLCGEPNVLLKTIRNSLNQDKNDIAETL